MKTFLNNILKRIFTLNWMLPSLHCLNHVLFLFWLLSFNEISLDSKPRPPKYQANDVYFVWCLHVTYCRRHSHSLRKKEGAGAKQCVIRWNLDTSRTTLDLQPVKQGVNKKKVREGEFKMKTSLDGSESHKTKKKDLSASQVICCLLR